MLWPGLPTGPRLRPKVSLLCPHFWRLLMLETCGHAEWLGRETLPQPTLLGLVRGVAAEDGLTSYGIPFFSSASAQDAAANSSITCCIPATTRAIRS